MKGILLTNLGTPEEPTVKAVRNFLAEFLWDPRVVELPRPLWWLILNLVILPFRPKKSAEAYEKVWTANGSPLLDISKQQVAALQEKLNGSAEVALAMRYGKPSIESALKRFQDQNIDDIIVLPLYPQYSATTTASTFDAIAKVFKSWRKVPKLTLINHYFEHPAYIQAVATSIKSHWASKPRPEKLLFSFHGLPQAMVDKGDPYYRQCLRSTELIVASLGLNENEWVLSFQSRLGRAQWLQPYTDKTLEQLAADGVKSVDVICPGFSADCLETLEEIDMQNREIFLTAGGEEFNYIPALNSSSDHIDALVEILKLNQN